MADTIDYYRAFDAASHASGTRRNHQGRCHLSIHPTSVISPKAEIGEGVHIGPFCVIEADVTVGDGTHLAARSTIKQAVTLGSDNYLGEGVVLGGLAQHLTPPENPGRVTIGDRNVFRENSTVHRAMSDEKATSIGNDCLLMVNAHVAHDCQVDDSVILTNNVMLGGHVQVGSRACLGGGVAIHQHCRVGRLAMIGGMARVIQDVPPFVMIDGSTGLIVGLNRVGLRRAGLDRHEISDLKEAYQVMYRSGLSLDERLEELDNDFSAGPCAEYAEFFRGGSRGFVRERRTPPGSTIRPIHDAIADSKAKIKALDVTETRKAG